MEYPRIFMAQGDRPLRSGTCTANGQPSAPAFRARTTEGGTRRVVLLVEQFP
jgi:hypothetical protein